MRMKLVQLISVGLFVTALSVTGIFSQTAQGAEVTLGSDGTIYLVTRVAATSTTSGSTELTAYDGVTGVSKPTLTIPIGNLDGPFPAPDGRLFLVAEGHAAYATKKTTVAAENAQLIIVNPAGTYSTVTLSGETAFGPVFLGTSTSYKYYFTVTSVGEGSSGKPVITSVLYVYTSANDTQLFSIPLD